MTAPLADIAPSEKLAGHDATLAELDRRLGRKELTLVAGPDAVWTGPTGFLSEVFDAVVRVAPPTFRRRLFPRGETFAESSRTWG